MSEDLFNFDSEKIILLMFKHFQDNALDSAVFLDTSTNLQLYFFKISSLIALNLIFSLNDLSCNFFSIFNLSVIYLL